MNEDNLDKVGEIDCLNCGNKIAIDLTEKRLPHSFCCDRCENIWQEKYGELVDQIAVMP